MPEGGGWPGEGAEHAEHTEHTGPVAEVRRPGSIAAVAWAEGEALLRKHESKSHPDLQDPYAWAVAEYVDLCGWAQVAQHAGQFEQAGLAYPIVGPKAEDAASGVSVAGRSERDR